MKIKVLFDKDTLDKDLYTGWGVSFLIGDKVLFDTGENGEWLLSNMEKMKVDIDKLERIVISHEHWDHAGGLWSLLEKKPGLTVSACPHSSPGFKKKIASYGGILKEAHEFSRISGDIYNTGEVLGTYGLKYIPEQAAALKTEKGVVIVTGCAHPGIIKMIERVKENLAGDIYLVFGGFHLKSQPDEDVRNIISEFRSLNIKKAGPTHCTGDRAIELFEKEYKKDFLEIKTGQIIEI